MPRRSVFLQKLLKTKADLEYEAALAEWHERVDARSKEVAECMADRAYTAALGLPAGLPAEAVAILSHTQALDAMAGAMPSRRRFYIKYGLL